MQCFVNRCSSLASKCGVLWANTLVWSFGQLTQCLVSKCSLLVIKRCLLVSKCGFCWANALVCQKNSVWWANALIRSVSGEKMHSFGQQIQVWLVSRHSFHSKAVSSEYMLSFGQKAFWFGQLMQCLEIERSFWQEDTLIGSANTPFVS